MTNQEAYVKIIDGLLVQGTTCADDTGYCKYHWVDPDGKHLRCAVGLLATSDEEAENWQHVGVHDGNMEALALASMLTGVPSDFLRNAQASLHDSTARGDTQTLFDGDWDLIHENFVRVWQLEIHPAFRIIV